MTITEVVKLEWQIFLIALHNLDALRSTKPKRTEEKGLFQSPFLLATGPGDPPHAALGNRIRSQLRLHHRLRSKAAPQPLETAFERGGKRILRRTFFCRCISLEVAPGELVMLLSGTFGHRQKNIADRCCEGDSLEAESKQFGKMGNIPAGVVERNRQLLFCPVLQFQSAGDAQRNVAAMDKYLLESIDQLLEDCFQQTAVDRGKFQNPFDGGFLGRRKDLQQFLEVAGDLVESLENFFPEPRGQLLAGQGGELAHRVDAEQCERFGRLGCQS